jgi:hypothetical protein
MVHMLVVVDGKWKPGVSLEYETQPVEFNHIFYSHCGDYHARVIGFFSGMDAWGKSHRMAEVEEFLRFNTSEYLAQHGIAEATDGN